MLAHGGLMSKAWLRVSVARSRMMMGCDWSGTGGDERATIRENT